MGRPLRRQAPGQYYLVTTRCHQARFFLRPDPELNQAVLEWLTRAQRAFPGLRLYAVCVMSNHLHLVVRDDESELSAWASYFLGNLARAVNRIRRRTGVCFERRYSAEPILDSEALHDRLVYVVTNPVQAALCPRVRDWPGILLHAAGGRPKELRTRWIDRDAQRRAGGASQPKRHLETGRETHQVEGHLIVDPLPEDGADSSDVQEAIGAREQTLAEERRSRGRKTLSRAQLLAQRWHAAPQRPKRGPRPPCHASDPGLRQAFCAGFHEFIARFRDAAERLRSGSSYPRFPEWSYPPGRPLVRPVVAVVR